MGQAIGKEILVIILVSINPIVLIHGYSEDSSVWDSWVNWLRTDNFTDVYPVSFQYDDECGKVADHGRELSGMIDKILNDTNSKHVDVITHSKGGLDARYYISYINNNTDSNLVMLGTPNLGTLVATMEVTDCWFQGMAGRKDLLPGSEATQSPDQKGTKYYSVAGNYSVPCAFMPPYRSACYIFENDGFVTVDSALYNYTSLGVFPVNHAGLLTEKDIYQKVIENIK
jgi:pimeloyl-ACP methyl ester carboxylesterase